MKRAVVRHLLISGIVLVAVAFGFLVWVFIVPTRFGASMISDISTSAIPKEKIDQSNVQYLAATDGVRLAYRAYIPASPVAIVIFYHGSGANSGAGYTPEKRSANTMTLQPISRTSVDMGYLGEIVETHPRFNRFTRTQHP